MQALLYIRPINRFDFLKAHKPSYHHIIDITSKTTTASGLSFKVVQFEISDIYINNLAQQFTGRLVPKI